MPSADELNSHFRAPPNQGLRNNNAGPHRWLSLKNPHVPFSSVEIHITLISLVQILGIWEELIVRTKEEQSAELPISAVRHNCIIIRIEWICSCHCFWVLKDQPKYTWTELLRSEYYFKQKQRNTYNSVYNVPKAVWMNRLRYGTETNCTWVEYLG